VQQLTNPYQSAYAADLAGQSTGAPADWFEVQKRAIAAAQRIPQRYTWPLLFKKSVVFFWFSPSVQALLTCLFNRNTVYLCWGMPRQSDAKWLHPLKLWRLKVILKLARTVLVNDEKTAEDLASLGVTNVTLFPYVVDTDFFTFSGHRDRDDFLLVPGDSDRDERLISALAAALPHKVVRVTRNAKTADFYRENPAVDVLCNVSFSHLLQLYQKARLVLLPLNSSDHAAGQTSILEALACGGSVLISQGRTSSIVNQYPSVLEVSLENALGDSPQTTLKTESQMALKTWCTAIESMLQLTAKQPNVAETTARQIKETHNLDTVSRQLSSILISAGDSS